MQKNQKLGEAEPSTKSPIKKFMVLVVKYCTVRKFLVLPVFLDFLTLYFFVYDCSLQIHSLVDYFSLVIDLIARSKPCGIIFPYFHKL